MKIHPNIFEALRQSKPVVALESTIITHGMPYPDNYKTALEVESIIKEKAVEPATIGVIDGMIHIGMSEDDLHRLAKSPSSVKISRRGLSASIAMKQTGGTTVSATMLLAHWCNIPIFVTGGIGGVHKDGENSMDVSSDLTELGKTPVTVISAGVKSILDIPRTLEYLETQGVTVATFGGTADFPAFFTPKSGCKSQLHLKSAKEAAAVLQVSADLGLQTGCLVAVPIPEEYAASGEDIEAAIQQAVKEAETDSIIGSAVTPYILKRVNELTGGASLKANVALIKNNASVGADIAQELAKLGSDVNQTSTKPDRPVVIGGTNVDVVAKCQKDILYHGPSNPASINYTLGGVGRNIAEGLARLGDDPVFISAVGGDAHAYLIHEEMKHYLDLSFVEKFPNQSCGIYNALLNRKGELELGASDMDIHDKITIDFVMKNEDVIMEAPLVCVDGNLPTETIHYLCDFCKRRDLDLFFEPTGSLKAMRPFLDSSHWKSIKYISPNIQEFEVIVSAVTGKTRKINLQENAHFSESALKSMYEACRPLLEHIYCIIVTLGKSGVATFVQDDQVGTGVKGTHYPLSLMPKWEWLRQPVVNVSGSGDTFSAAFIHGIISGQSIDTSTKMGIMAAQYTLRSRHTISHDLEEEMFTDLNAASWDTNNIE